MEIMKRRLLGLIIAFLYGRLYGLLYSHLLSTGERIKVCF